MNRPLRLALDNGHAFPNSVTDNEISDFKTNEVTTSQLAIDRKIKERQVPEVAREFQPGADGPDLFSEQWAFLADKSPLVPSPRFRFDGGKLNIGH
ncbi:hypothetical protein Z950_1128 [Sulfitobacter mediterraneus KCTC 32188]|nr:hypothetical protein Z950_1128 [Sulfitobacter mediterraneus KCTC 32188]